MIIHEIQSSQLPQSSAVKIMEIIDLYLSRLDGILQNEEDTLEDVLSQVLLIAEVFDYIDDKEYWLYNIQKLFTQLQNEIDRGMFRSISCIHGLSELSFITKTVYKKTGEFKKLAQSTYSELLDRTKSVCNFYTEKLNETETAHYDFISGLSGTGLYLNSQYRDVNLKSILMNISDYLATISSISANGIPNWLIKTEQQSDYNRVSFPGGHVDFGFAHGVAAPMLFLACTTDAADTAKLNILEKLIEIYMENETTGDLGFKSFPSIIPFSKYESKKYDNKDLTSVLSWCYGALTMLWPLLRVSLKIKNEVFYNKFKDDILSIYSKEHYFKFYFPVLCHGYGSAILTNNLFADMIGSHRYLDLNDKLVKNILTYYDPDLKFLFQNLQKDDMLTGAPGVIIALLGSLTGETELEKFLLPR